MTNYEEHFAEQIEAARERFEDVWVFLCNEPTLETSEKHKAWLEYLKMKNR